MFCANRYLIIRTTCNNNRNGYSRHLAGPRYIDILIFFARVNTAPCPRAVLAGRPPKKHARRGRAFHEMKRYSPRDPRQCDENANKLILSCVWYILARQNGPRAFGPWAVLAGENIPYCPQG